MLHLSLQVAIEFPYVLAQTLIYSTIFYSLAAFEWTFLKFVWYLVFMYFTLLYFTFFGMMTTATTPNHNVAAIFAAPFYMFWNLFSGFMIAYKVLLLCECFWCVCVCLCLLYFSACFFLFLFFQFLVTFLLWSS